MERISNEAVSQAIGQPGHSLTWRRETKTCEDCGQPYEAQIASAGGVDRPYRKTCQECEQKRRDEELRQRATAELEKTKETQRDIWFETCNLPLKFANKNFDDFQRELQLKAYSAAKKFAGNYCNWSGNEPLQSLILLSPDTYGVGKTHLVAAIINHILKTEKAAYFRPNSLTVSRRRLPIYFITELELLSKIRTTFSRNEGQIDEDIYRELINYDLLVIDDIGKIRPRDPSFMQGVYFRVIDGRYASEQAIVLTTNLDYHELEEHIGGACADRLREMCGDNFIKMTGKSYRLKGKE